MGVCHLNEGHAALLGLALLGEQQWQRTGSMVTDADLDAARSVADPRAMSDWIHLYDRPSG